MARPPSLHPTDGELEILHVLWASGPAALSQICTILRRQRPVATTTVATMLKVMLGKGLIERQRGPRGPLWVAKVSRQAAATSLLRKLVDRLFDGSAQWLVAHLVEAGELSEADKKVLRRLLEPPRNEKKLKQ